jgi:hypothetical protein
MLFEFSSHGYSLIAHCRLWGNRIALLRPGVSDQRNTMACGLSCLFDRLACRLQEPYGINNPRSHMGSSPDGHGLRKGVQPGEGAIREVAAFLLDHKV